MMLQGVVGVGHVLTVHSSPDQVTVMMNVDFQDEMPAAEVERIVCHIEEEARERWPQVQAAVHPPDGQARQSSCSTDRWPNRCTMSPTRVTRRS